MTRVALVPVLALVISACGSEPPAPPAAEAHPADHAHPPTDGHAAHGTTDPHARHAGGSGDLKSIMVDLGERMEQAQGALWADDLAGVQAAAQAVADHPHVAPTEMSRIQGLLGPEFSDFAKADKRVHDAAVRLADAAGDSDVAAVLRELGAVQTGCVACHASFRERLTVRP